MNAHQTLLQDLSLLVGITLPSEDRGGLDALAERLAKHATQTLGASSCLLYVAEDARIRVLPAARARHGGARSEGSAAYVPAGATPTLEALRGPHGVSIEHGAPARLAPDRSYAERLTLVVSELGLLELVSAERGVFDDHLASVLSSLQPWLAEHLRTHASLRAADAREQEARAEAERLRATFDGLPGAAWSADAEGVIETANAEGRALLGDATRLSDWRRARLSAVEAGRVEAALAAARDAARVDLTLRYRLSSGRALEERVRFRHAPQGQLLGTTSLLHDAPATAAAGPRIDALRVHQVAAARADTVRAEAEKSSRAKTEFLNLLSHELRAPLFPIIALSDLLLRSRETATEQDLAEQLHVINNAGHQMLGLVTDLLDISRLDSGRLRASLGPVSLDHLVESLRAKYPEAASTGRLEIGVLDGLGRQLYTDRNVIDRVASALLSYALEQLDAAHTHLELTQQERTIRIVLRVRAGAPPELPATSATMFEPFWERAHERGGRGQGLSLTLVRRFALAFGGSAAAEVRGEERRFEIVLPSVATAERQSLELLGERALVSSADLGSAVAVALELVARGAEVRLASTADETIAALGSRQPGVLFLDARLPGLRAVESVLTQAASGAAPAIVTVEREGDAVPLGSLVAHASLSLPGQQGRAGPLMRNLLDLRKRPSLTPPPISEDQRRGP